MKTHIPNNARIERHFRAVLPDGPDKGKTLCMYLHAGHASKGRQSDYKPVPHRWLEIVAYDARHNIYSHWAWTYSGRRYAVGLAEFDGLAADIRAQFQAKFGYDAAEQAITQPAA